MSNENEQEYWEYITEQTEFSREDYEWLLGRVRNDYIKPVKLCIYHFKNGVIISANEHPSKPNDPFNIGEFPKWRSR